MAILKKSKKALKNYVGSMKGDLNSALTDVRVSLEVLVTSLIHSIKE